ncbi:MarR family winged helix-turn-helix transcriptional regulator [Acidiferrimicrobium sp. IK]|uniref:MarR family winged helix-turn-helix transcriptional regulator n=1 Tax=Acidiferrimicrobium sp. IK TaxID=2871700 RepID=UPI0021CB6975|nr:MarR family winged helix-turn-helix transcriptional regulator [Acidiferrimicrobium sp. IK]MCU4185453.1 MarR family winged helix-turn-helix transcriptional regulator [Acidiferrimicrobium sp. IK]
MSDTRWLDDEEALAWRNWLVLSARVRAAVGRDLARDHAMSEPEYAVLVNLSEAPEHRLRMSELAARLDWSRSRLSHLLGRMETRGLVTRVDCPEDGRSSFAALTDLGLEEIRLAAPSHVASVRRHFVDLLPRDELVRLGSLATAMLERLEAAAGPCPGTAAGPCPGTAVACGEDSEQAHHTLAKGCPEGVAPE